MSQINKNLRMLVDYTMGFTDIGRIDNRRQFSSTEQLWGIITPADDTPSRLQVRCHQCRCHGRRSGNCLIKHWIRNLKMLSLPYSLLRIFRDLLCTGILPVVGPRPSCTCTGKVEAISGKTIGKIRNRSKGNAKTAITALPVASGKKRDTRRRAFPIARSIEMQLVSSTLVVCALMPEPSIFQIEPNAILWTLIPRIR